MDQDERVSRLRPSQAVTYGRAVDVVAYARQVGRPVEAIWPSGPKGAPGRTTVAVNLAF